MSNSSVSLVNKYLLRSGEAPAPPAANNTPLETNQTFPYNETGMSISSFTDSTVQPFTLSAFSSAKNGSYEVRASSYAQISGTHRTAMLVFSDFTNSQPKAYYTSSPNWDSYNDDGTMRKYTQDPYSSGNYIGGGTGFFWTTIYDSGSVDGDYIQIKFPFKALIKSYSDRPVAFNWAWQTRVNYILGSDDGTTWFYIGQTNFTYITQWNFRTQTFPSNTKRFQYIRVVFQAGHNSTRINASNMKFDLDIYDLTADTE